MTKLQTIFIILSLVILLIPRFNWEQYFDVQSLIGREKYKKTLDINQYTAYTEYFRGKDKAEAELQVPFTYRVFVPLLASLLPFDALTSINVTNFLFLILSIFFLQKLLKEFKFSRRYIFYGELLFVYSFPVFYYASVGYVEPVLIFFIIITFYLLIKEMPIRFLLAFIVGITVKETIVIMIPVAVVYVIFNETKSLKNKVLYIFIIITAYFVIIFLIRYFAPGKGSYIWLPKTELFLYNTKRIAGFATTLLSFGLPGLGAILFVTCPQCKKFFGNMKYTLLTGMLVGILVSGYAITAAYAEGRYIWITYPFTIPLALVYIKHFFGEKKSLRQTF